MDGGTRIDSMEPDKADTTKISKAYPLEFHYVKALFLQNQYRQCIHTSRQVLDAADGESDQTRHPLEETFMRFYLALAHDELARAMHNFSSTKMAAFAQAEGLYREAAALIPGADECDGLLKQHGANAQGEDVQAKQPLPQPESLSTLNSDVFRRAPSPSPLLSPPTQTQPSVPNITSPGSADSETEEDDLESNDSFDIMTPNRMQRLPSTYSSMSLLQPQKQSHSLLRPVRPAPAAKPYKAPPRLSISAKEYRSRLPRLNTTSSLGSPQPTPPRQSSPVRKQLRFPDEEWSPDLPESPVSPLGSAYVSSDDTAISPISPSTPIDTKSGADFAREPEISSSSFSSTMNPISSHLQALHSQIETHISLLEEAKQRTLTAQAERETKNNMRKVPASKAAAGGMPQSRSFWLFTPEDMKVAEKQRRMEEGRQRMWMRVRFDPGRYQGLAERALGEL